MSLDKLHQHRKLVEAQARFQLFGSGVGICGAVKDTENDRMGRVQVGWAGSGI